VCCQQAQPVVTPSDHLWGSSVKSFSRIAIALGSVLAVAIALLAGLLFSGGSASAAGQPSYEPDPNALGTLSFFDASGNQITSGSATAAPMAAFYMASGLGVAGNNKAYVSFYTPVQGQTPAAWQTGNQVTAAQTYPNATYPGVLGTTSNAVVKDAAADGSLDANQIQTFPSSSTTDPNVYQVRMFTDTSGTHYYSADVLVSGTTWTQVYPAPPATKINTSLSTPVASPSSPTPHATSVTLTSTLTASDSSHPAGSVHLFDGTADQGAATSFTASTGAVSSTLTPADGSHSYKFVFTPTSTATYNGATSAVLSYTVNPLPAATPTTTTLAVSPASPSTVGDTLTLTATVAPSAAGTVQFLDGTSAIGSPVSVSGGTATRTTSALTVGTHSLTATFTPTDPTAFLGSTSTPATSYTVNAAPATTTSTSLTVSPTGPVGFGTTVILSGAVTPTNAVGSIKFFDGTTQVGATQAWNGTGVSVSTSTLGVGTHSLTAQFVPTNPANFGTSTSTPASSLTVTAATTTTSLAVSPAGPVIQGSSMTLTATIAPAAAPGTVAFFDNTTAIGSPVAVSGAQAHLTTTTLAQGVHALHAVFNSTSTNYSGSTSPDVPLTVNAPPPGTTTTGLTVTPNPAVVGSTVTLKATVAPSTATGSVQFHDGATPVGAPTAVTAGVAQLTTNALTQGSHALTAQFTPTNNFTGSTSSPVTLQVIPPPTATTTTLTVSPAGPVAHGTAVTLDGAVTPNTAVGAVQFLDGTTVLGTSPLSNGAASLTLSTLASGPHSLTAKFVPTDVAAFGTSTSTPATSLTVDAQATTTTLAVAPAGPVTVGNTVTLTATLIPSSAAGTVRFLDGTTQLGTSAVSAGKATLKTTKLVAGDHSLTAQFVPTNTTLFGGSVSSAVTLTVKKAPVITSCTSDGNSVPQGGELKPGAVVTLNAAGFQPDEKVTVIVQSTPVTLGTATASVTGAVTATVTLPSSLAAGSHTLTLKGSLASAVFSFSIAAAVTPSPTPGSGSAPLTPSPASGGGLAATGASISSPAVIALLLLLLGGALALAASGKRRRLARGSYR